jgi:DNA ligase-1
MPGTPLDGEMFAGRGMFNRMQGMIRDGWHGLTFQVFDAPAVQGGFAERFATLGKLALPSHAVVVPQVVCSGMDHFVAAARAIVQGGGEGVVVRNPAGLYRAGRSNDVQRIVPQPPEKNRIAV